MQIEEAFKKLERIDVIERLLTQIQRQLQVKDNDDIGDVEMASIVTGLSTSTIYQYTSKGTIPHYKKANRIYFSRKKLEEWIKSGERGNDLSAY